MGTFPEVGGEEMGVFPDEDDGKDDDEDGTIGEGDGLTEDDEILVVGLIDDDEIEGEEEEEGRETDAPMVVSMRILFCSSNSFCILCFSSSISSRSFSLS